MFTKATQLYKTSIAGIIIVGTLMPIHSYAACSTNITKTAPDSRYGLLNSGSEVKDKKIGLIWQRCSLGQTWDGNSNSCIGRATTHTWKEALEKASALGNGYRLPNIKELQTLVEEACHSPAINTTIFPNTETSSYWSASPKATNTSKAWVVDFKSGDASFYYDKNTSYHVRAVRASQ